MSDDDELEHLRKILLEAKRLPKKSVVSRFVDCVWKKMSQPINQPKSQKKASKEKVRRKPAA